MNFFFPIDSLPADNIERNNFLDGYFCDQRSNAELQNDQWVVETYWPPTFDFFVDPLVSEGFSWWRGGVKAHEVHKEVTQLPEFQLSLNDCWTLYSWSKWLSRQDIPPKEVIILHADFHNDLMSPRLCRSQTGYTDLLTGDIFDIKDPGTVKKSILSGAVGIGSFMVPLLHEIEKVHLRHLCDGHLTDQRSDINALVKEWGTDELFAIGQNRPKVSSASLNEHALTTNSIRYKITDKPKEWIADLPNAPILLHIDMDYFNCRYDGDSDWQKHPPRFDPDFLTIEKKMEMLFSAINDAGLNTRIEDIAIALSPGFYPAEYWKPSIEKITELVYKLNQ